MGAVKSALRLIPELSVETVESSRCGMAVSFGYDASTIDVSLKMGELSVLPAVRKAEANTLVVADDTLCQHQIHDGAGRAALPVARVLAMSIEATR
jgi:Fe-S oxidoreductase